MTLEAHLQAEVHQVEGREGRRQQKRENSISKGKEVGKNMVLLGNSYAAQNSWDQRNGDER